MCNFFDDLNWGLHIVTLCKRLKDHKGLRTLKVSAFQQDEPFNDEAVFGRNYSYLRELLSHNRYITVTDDDDAIYTDGCCLVDELYSLNRFYRGSAGLLMEPPPERPSLVTTALRPSAPRITFRVRLS